VISGLRVASCARNEEKRELVVKEGPKWTINGRESVKKCRPVDLSQEKDAVEGHELGYLIR
jgi:hypothetical protein